ncbi:hypothetical protein BH20ACT4_BH20ACT4_11030 [soil metagenome]
MTSTARRHLVALAASATFVFASCGDDGDGTEPSDTGSTGTGSTEPDSTEPDSTDPGGSDATTAEPTDPAATDPAATDPAASDPAATGDGLSAEEWRSQFDELCDEAREAGQELEEPETIGEFRESIDSIIELGDKLFEDAAELTPPAELEEGYSTMADLWDDQRGKLEDLNDRIESGYDEDQLLTDIPDEEGRELVGDALDQSALTDQAQELGVSCFNPDD